VTNTIDKFTYINEEFKDVSVDSINHLDVKTDTVDNTYPIYKS
jgi:hypothetical protein